MLKDCIEIFDAVYKENLDNGRNITVDDYIPDKGRYIIVDENFTSYKVIDVKIDKEGNIEDESLDELHFIKMAEYYSKIFSTNKAVDFSKIIHSNNYLSFFAKGENFKNGKVNSNKIKEFYDTLLNIEQKYDRDKKTKEIYSKVEEDVGEINKELLEKCKNWLLDNFENIEILNEKEKRKMRRERVRRQMIRKELKEAKEEDDC